MKPAEHLPSSTYQTETDQLSEHRVDTYQPYVTQLLRQQTETNRMSFKDSYFKFRACV